MAAARSGHGSVTSRVIVARTRVLLEQQKTILLCQMSMATLVHTIILKRSKKVPKYPISTPYSVLVNVYADLSPGPLAECTAVDPFSWQLRVLRHSAEATMLLTMTACEISNSYSSHTQFTGNSVHNKEVKKEQWR